MCLRNVKIQLRKKVMIFLKNAKSDLNFGFFSFSFFNISVPPILEYLLFFCLILMRSGMKVYLVGLYAANYFFSEILNWLAPKSKNATKIRPNSTFKFPRFQSSLVSTDFHEIWHECSSIMGPDAANKYFFTKILNVKDSQNLKTPKISKSII